MRAIELENQASFGDSRGPTPTDSTVTTTPEDLVRIPNVFFVDIIGPAPAIHQSHAFAAIMDILGHLDEFERS